MRLETGDASDVPDGDGPAHATAEPNTHMTTAIDSSPAHRRSKLEQVMEKSPSLAGTNEENVTDGWPQPPPQPATRTRRDRGRDARPRPPAALADPAHHAGRALTNKEIASRLGRDPGTVLYHVRVLAREGFLAEEGVRAGKRGARERPYRASGKSWRIRLKPDAGSTAAILDAAREEIVEFGDGAAITTLRLGVRLRPADIADLKRRIAELGDEFEPRDDPTGEPVAIVALAHRRRP